MIAIMAKTPKKAAERSPEEKPQIVYLRLDDDTAASLALYISRQDVEPSPPMVTLKALREFLASRGCYPPPPVPKPK